MAPAQPSSLLLLAQLAVVALGACRATPESDHANPPMDPKPFLTSDPDSTTVLVTAKDTVAVLIYAASDCFTCYGVLAGWLAWEQRGSGEVHLFLRSQPTSAEARRLARYNIDDYHVLASSYEAGGPTTHLYIRGRLAASARARPGSDFILSSLELTAAQPRTEPMTAANQGR